VSYYAVDANDYIDDVASVGGWHDFVVWADEQDSDVLRQFVETGVSDDPAELADELSALSADDPSVEDVLRGLEKCARAADEILIVSDGTSDEESDDIETLGGKGSGNFGHSGRPGKIGGSSEGHGEVGSDEPGESLPTAAAAEALVAKQKSKDEEEYLTPGEYEKLPPGIRAWKIAKRKADAEAAKKAGETKPEVKPVEVKPVEPVKPKEPEKNPDDKFNPILESDVKWDLQKEIMLRRTNYTSAYNPFRKSENEIPAKPEVNSAEKTEIWKLGVDRANEMAAKMGLDPNLIVVRNYEGRQFLLNGQTGLIEVNTQRDGHSRGVIVHEIAHAQWDYVRSRASEETDLLQYRWLRESSPNFRGTRYFTKQGVVRKSKQAEVEAMAPHLSVLSRAGLGSRYLGIEPDREGMIKDDGVSSYSRMYWTQYEQKGAKKPRQVEYTGEIAVNETMSEIARRQLIPEKESGDYGYNTMAPRFLNLRNKIKELYEKDPASVKTFFANKKRG
jgi:hypothetical protein